MGAAVAVVSEVSEAADEVETTVLHLRLSKSLLSTPVSSVTPSYLYSVKASSRYETLEPSAATWLAALPVVSFLN